MMYRLSISSSVCSKHKERKRSFRLKLPPTLPPTKIIVNEHSFYLIILLHLHLRWPFRNKISLLFVHSKTKISIPRRKSILPHVFPSNLGFRKNSKQVDFRHPDILPPHRHRPLLYLLRFTTTL